MQLHSIQKNWYLITVEASRAAIFGSTSYFPWVRTFRKVKKEVKKGSKTETVAL